MAGIGFNNAPHYKVSPGWFVGRELQWLKIKRFDDNNGGLDNAVIQQVVNVLQRHAEVFFVGEPHVSDNWGKFMVLVALNTFNDGSNTDSNGNVQTNPNATTLAEDLQSLSLGGDGVQVEYWAITDGDAFGPM